MSHHACDISSLTSILEKTADPKRQIGALGVKRLPKIACEIVPASQQNRPVWPFFGFAYESGCAVDERDRFMRRGGTGFFAIMPVFVDMQRVKEVLDRLVPAAAFAQG